MLISISYLCCFFADVAVTSTITVLVVIVDVDVACKRKYGLFI